jgi:ribonuclease E
LTVMANDKMLIDATHPEETRVVVLKSNRVEEFDYESAAKKLLRGNIYLAKVTRVEPSLQAAFVDYGGNRHGFLAFSEIHPDYYQIPVADRQALLEAEAEAAAQAEAEADAAEEAARKRREASGKAPTDDEAEDGDTDSDDEDDEIETIETGGSGGSWAEEADETQHGASGGDSDAPAHQEPATGIAERNTAPLDFQQLDAGQNDLATDGAVDEPNQAFAANTKGADTKAERVPASADFRASDVVSDHVAPDDPAPSSATGEHDHNDLSKDANGHDHDHDHALDTPRQPAGDSSDIVESVGAEDALEEVPQRRRRSLRSYKIQEVIRRRQIMLVQVVKEERGNKGAALTTYLSLAGRYTVLMPNTGRGGGISRKITNAADRKRLKEIATELEIPDGMGLIVRTAGASRSKAEVKRDFEYLLRLWENVRDLTLQSTAPALVYEEGNLIKRSIRDLYSKEIDKVIVAGEGAYRDAKDFMRMIMPSHAGNVVPYQSAEPLFVHYQIERQLNAMYSPTVTLKSGGYIVLNQTEALVAVDVNSGRSTREHNIEDTALNTNLEACDEIARQLRLRDLAGLIVIDFIDMEERRNNRNVERRLKDALKHDRARIQVGRISHFGLMEMSRQRLRTGIVEGSTSQCPHCVGTGVIRSVESVSLGVLRSLEDTLSAGRRRNLTAVTSVECALYLLNHKRDYLRDIEDRHGVKITVQADDTMHGATFRVDLGEERTDAKPMRLATSIHAIADAEIETVNSAVDDDLAMDQIDDEDRDGADADTVNGDAIIRDTDADGDDEQKTGRRRRRRRRGRGDRVDGDRAEGTVADANGSGSSDDEQATEGNDNGETGEDSAEDGNQNATANGEDRSDSERNRRRRRGRRGGRRNRGDGPRDGVAANGDGGTDVMEGSAGATDGNGDITDGRLPDDHTLPDAALASDPSLTNAAIGSDNHNGYERSVHASTDSAAESATSAALGGPPSVATDVSSAEPARIATWPDESLAPHVVWAPAPTTNWEPERVPTSWSSDALTSHSGTRAGNGHGAATERALPEPAAEPEPTEPAGPPRKGWWQRRFSGG